MTCKCNIKRNDVSLGKRFDLVKFIGTIFNGKLKLDNRSLLHKLEIVRLNGQSQLTEIAQCTRIVRTKS